LKEAIVLSQSEAERYISHKPYAIISITDCNIEKQPTFMQSQFLMGILRMEFDDVDTHTEGYTLFNSKQALQILDFVESIKDDIEILVVHCWAGISRSAGVAAAIDDLYIESDKRWFTVKSPNYHVYRTIHNAHRFRDEIEGVIK
jgi:predicted protein tyrosine phosphatase